MITLEAGPTLSGVSPLDRVRFVRDELADDLVISAVISMAAIEIWRHIMITTQWLENLVKRNISNYEERVRDQARDEFIAEGRAQVLDVLDEDTRKDIERKLHDNHHPENGD